MITFFALRPDATERQKIAEWRERSLPPFERPVSAANLHITLVYLGETADWQFEALLDQTSVYVPEPFTLRLNQVGYWPKPRVFWLGPTQTPDELGTLVSQTRQLAGSLRLQRDKRTYQPHLTLARKLAFPPPAPADSPDFELRFTEFVLMESCRSAAGANYRVLERFN